jgi:hypothetical protein
MGLLSGYLSDQMGLYGGMTRDLLGYDLQGSQNLGNTILGYGDQRLQGGQMNLDAAMGATQADLAALQGLQGIAGMTGDYDLGLLGAGNDLIGSQMQGYAQQGALQNQGSAQRYQSDMARYQYDMDRFNYMRDAPRQNYLEAIGTFGSLGQTFGTQNSYQTGPPRQYQAGNPVGGAFQGFMGGVLDSYGQNGQFPWQGGQQYQQPPGGGYNPYYGYPIGDPNPWGGN